MEEYVKNLIFSINPPKKRTREYLHDLFLRLVERKNERIRLRSEFISNKILKDIEKSPDGRWRLYFDVDMDNNTHRSIEFEKSVLCGKEQLSFTYEYSRDRHNRFEKLDFLLATEKSFQYADEFRALSKLVESQMFLYKVKDRLENSIKEYLYANIDIWYGHSNIVIQLGNYEYIVNIESPYDCPTFNINFFEPNAPKVRM